jgi:hypothetical protein
MGERREMNSPTETQRTWSLGKSDWIDVGPILDFVIFSFGGSINGEAILRTTR